MGTGQHIIRTGGVFTSLITPGRDNRTLWGIDSKTYDATATDQGFSMGAAMMMWDIPQLADGTPGVVGMAGGCFTTLTRLWAQPTLTHGWTRTATAPDGTYTGANPTTDHGPNFSVYYTKAALAARNAHSATSNATGTAFSAFANLNANNSSNASVASTQIGAGVNPFSGRQTMARLIGDYAGADGPDDMRVKGVRQRQNSLTYGANDTWYGTPSDPLDLTDITAGPWYADVDCGAGYGAPGIALINPDVPVDTNAMKMILTGVRICRDSSLTPIAGTSFASFGYTGYNMEQHAGCLGVSGYTQYYSAANASLYLQYLCGRGVAGSKYPNIIVIYTGHNFSSAEQTDLQTLQAGGSGTHVYRDNLLAVINQHKANAAALSDPVPQFLVVYAEWHSLTAGASNDDAGFALAARDEVIAACNSSGAELVDLFGETWDGVQRDFTVDSAGGSLSVQEKCARWPYMKGATTNSAAGSGSGPIEDTSADFTHNSFTGSLWLWRKVWDIGMAGIGKVPGVSLYSSRTDASVQRGRATMSPR